MPTYESIQKLIRNIFIGLRLDEEIDDFLQQRFRNKTLMTQHDGRLFAKKRFTNTSQEQKKPEKTVCNN
jgi:hypothetical protein